MSRKIVKKKKVKTDNAVGNENKVICLRVSTDENGKNLNIEKTNWTITKETEKMLFLNVDDADYTGVVKSYKMNKERLNTIEVKERNAVFLYIEFATVWCNASEVDKIEKELKERLRSYIEGRKKFYSNVLTSI